MNLSSFVEELEKLASGLQKYVLEDDAQVLQPAQQLMSAAKKLDASWSQGWVGYHACVYYNRFARPPAGARFSTQWGLYDIPIGGTIGDWKVYDFDAVVGKINSDAGNPDLTALKTLAEDGAAEFNRVKAEALSIIEIVQAEIHNEHLGRILENLEAFELPTRGAFLTRRSPKNFMTQDPQVILSVEPPPHLFVQSEVADITMRIHSCQGLSKIIGKAVSHLKRIARMQRRIAMESGVTVFIGHGRSMAWRDLKDFVKDRLRLPYDEFNRVPVAGVTNIARLSEMLDSAAIAFIIMTAEDEQTDGSVRARMNVIHEAGLFQGRLGFTRAIVLLEDGCAEFSNIQGLGQIRFPKGNIKAIFEDVREVLEREGVLAVTGNESTTEAIE